MPASRNGRPTQLAAGDPDGRRSLPRLKISGGTILTIGVLAILVFPNLQAQRVASPTGTVLLALGVGVFLILSVLLHEIGHAVLARAFGGHVEQIALTLWGGHTQYTGRRIGPFPSILIALAGPAVNALLAGAAYAVLLVVPAGGAASAFLLYAGVLNLGLAVFNLLPGLPMDGGRAVEGLLGGILRRRTLGTVITAWIGRAIAVLVVLLALWRLAGSAQTFSLIVVLWSVIIAGTLWQGASSALRGARTQDRIGRLEVRDVLRPVLLLPTSATAADVPATADPRTVLVLDATGSTGARVDPVALASVPIPMRTSTPIGAVARSIGAVGRVPVGLDGDDLVDHLVNDPRAEHLAVDADGRIVGTISTADVGARLQGS